MVIEAVRKYLDLSRKIVVNPGDRYEVPENEGKTIVLAGNAVVVEQVQGSEEKPVRTAKKPRKKENE